MELYLEREKPTRNAKNGRYLKGCKPWNTGKTMRGHMTEEEYNRMVERGRANLDRCRGALKGRPAHNKKKVIAVTRDGRWTCFDSIRKASEITGADVGHIIKVCKHKLITAKGYRWFYEFDDEVLKFIS